MTARSPRPPFGPYSPVRGLVYGDARFQDEPGWFEYPAYTVDIVSCELPSGVAWLLSCLLELRVPAWKPWNADTRLEWVPRADYRFRYWCPGDPWSRLCPCLVSGREFAFRPEPVPRYTHAWPGAQRPCPRTLLVVRDPRDALYSGWRRGDAGPDTNGQAAERFVAWANGRWGDRPFRRADYWDRFHAAWIDATTGDTSLVVRFEDFKVDPAGVLAKICGFLDLSASAEEIAAAVAMSDFNEVARIDRNMVERGVFDRAINRAGTPNEFLGSYTPAMHAVFAPEAPTLWEWFGYRPPGKR